MKSPLNGLMFGKSVKFNGWTCPYCGTMRQNAFPISDETGDMYCPDCNWTLIEKDKLKQIYKKETEK